MIPRTLAVALLAGGCLTAAAGGAYVAARHNAAEPPPVTAGPPPAAAPAAYPEAAQPVAETEALVDGTTDAVSTPAEAPAVTPPSRPAPSARPAARPRQEPARTARKEPPAEAGREREQDDVAAPRAAAVEVPVAEAAPAWPAAGPQTARPYEPPPPAEPSFEEVVIPASAVIGLQVETALTSERNQVEDRVEARVTRDVIADGRVAIPAGSRVIGTVTLVERGGKVKERARLGVRFHTVVLAGGLHVPVRTEAIIREGEPPSGESARKIGGAAAGGAILGAILGGGKGAAIGGAAGAGAGTAAVMASDRNHATLPAGTTVTARLASPVVIELER